MKRLISLMAAIVLVLTAVPALAVDFGLANLSAEKLFELYGQVISQKLLNSLENKSQYKSVTDYEDFERNPTRHTGDKIKFSGKVIQVVEGSGGSVTYRVAMDGSSSKVFVVNYERPAKAERILVDDQVTVYGVNEKLMTYSSTYSKSVTVPCCTAELVIRPITDSRVKSASKKEINATAAKIPGQIRKKVKTVNGYVQMTKGNYDTYARYDSLHKDEKVTYSGKVVQALESGSRMIYRIAVDSDSDRIVYTTIATDKNTYRILEDDLVTVKGSFGGLYTYSSTRGGDITIPSCAAEKVSLKGYNVPSSFPKDSKGRIKVSKTLMEDYARRPGAHEKENIVFSGKVLQVLEGSTSSEYRIAVDSDYNAVMYVTIKNSDRSMRVLEDDKVEVVAVFDGLLTYESTTGKQITIPQCIASSMTIPGKASATAKKNSSGEYQVSKSNYEAFARDEKTYLNQKLTFKAKVVQVSEGYRETVYRLAVDSDYNCIFYATMTPDKSQARILEDDIVTVSGTSTGLYTYSSVRSGMITIPSMSISSFTIQGFQKTGIGSANSSGYYTVNKSNYAQWARYPDLYNGKNITFRGKVVQVVEGWNGSNTYRVAVDSNYDCMFYVKFTLKSGTSRILENDIVTLTGEFTGIYTYTTLLGSSVSIPCIEAESMKK
ncbi:MAG: hypothetical protein IKP40_11055 [Clostridia bacterium]|nr:hypothetical protein [Clostridia bacterium]